MEYCLDFQKIFLKPSFTKGAFPDHTKLAVVTPIYKGKCKLEVSNYRLVSVLPILSKVLEKLMFNSTVDFLEKVKLYININMASKTASPHHILPLIFIQEL